MNGERSGGHRISRRGFLGSVALSLGRPRFSREAYHWLVKHGHEERAKSRLFDRPELALEIGLKGPTTNRDATIKAYYEATSAQ
jgi:hypothetical protein